MNGWEKEALEYLTLSTNGWHFLLEIYPPMVHTHKFGSSFLMLGSTSTAISMDLACETWKVDEWLRKRSAWVLIYIYTNPFPVIWQGTYFWKSFCNSCEILPILLLLPWLLFRTSAKRSWRHAFEGCWRRSCCHYVWIWCKGCQQPLANWPTRRVWTRIVNKCLNN